RSRKNKGITYNLNFNRSLSIPAEHSQIVLQLLHLAVFLSSTQSGSPRKKEQTLVSWSTVHEKDVPNMSTEEPLIHQPPFRLQHHFELFSSKVEKTTLPVQMQNQSPPKRGLPNPKLYLWD